MPATILITFSLAINVLVLVPVCFGLLNDLPWARQAYGEPTPARAILLAVYMAILVVSLVLLVVQSTPMVAALLLVQVVYKALTPLTAGSWDHPVVIANLVIVGLHAITLFVVWRSASSAN